jgi:hypothetical protein
MAIFVAMDVSLKESIEELGLARVSKKADIPLTTLWRWLDKEQIPGSPPVQEVRANQLRTAVEQLRAERPA